MPVHVYPGTLTGDPFPGTAEVKWFKLAEDGKTEVPIEGTPQLHQGDAIYGRVSIHMVNEVDGLVAQQNATYKFTLPIDCSQYNEAPPMPVAN